MFELDASELLGLADELRRAGDELDATLSTEVRAAGSAIEAHGKANAPVLTGYLRNSIGMDHEGLRAVIGPTAAYGPEQEFGTRFMAGRHFMSRAADTVTPEFERNVAAATARVLKGG